MTRSCADCQESVSYLQGRRLCSTCYHRHKKAGTLEQFPRLGPPSEGVPSVDGVSYRQLDYWSTKGWLRPTGGGSQGVARHWSEAELAVARTMGLLVGFGLKPAVAARVARGEQQIGPGVKVQVSA